MTGNRKAAYTTLSRETVQSLHQKYQKSLEAKARKAVPEDAPDADALAAALKALMIEATRKGLTLKAGDLSMLAAKGADAVNGKRKKVENRVHARARKWSRYRSPRLSVRQKWQIASAGKQRHDDAFVERVFDGQDRIYLRLQDTADVTETQRKVAAYLETKGYSITDYNKGYATDAAGKQQFKIGKLLKTDEELYKSFIDDSSRGLDRLLVIVSRKPMDIATMSTGHQWSSCLGSGGYNWRYVPRDVKKGSLIAYLVSEKDPDIINPLARILIKPYSGKKSGLAGIAEKVFDRKTAARHADAEKIFVPYASFGLHNQAFRATVEDFIEKKLNAGKIGDFWLVSGLHRDGNPRCITRNVRVPALS